jgi:hypothetical protein
MLVLGVDGKATEIAKGKNYFLKRIARNGSIPTNRTIDSQGSPEFWLRTSQGTHMILGVVERCTPDDGYPFVLSLADPPRVAFVDVHGSFVVVDPDSGAPVAETKNVVTPGADVLRSARMVTGWHEGDTHVVQDKLGLLVDRS